MQQFLTHVHVQRRQIELVNIDYRVVTSVLVSLNWKTELVRVIRLQAFFFDIYYLLEFTKIQLFFWILALAGLVCWKTYASPYEIVVVLNSALILNIRVRKCPINNQFLRITADPVSTFNQNLNIWLQYFQLQLSLSA